LVSPISSSLPTVLLKKSPTTECRLRRQCTSQIDEEAAVQAPLILLTDERNVSCSSNSGSCSPNRGPRHPTSSTCPSRCTFPISKVIPFSKLRTDYRSYRSRCRLAGHPSAAAAPPSPSLPVSSSSPPLSSFSSLRDTRLHENRLAWIRKGERIRADACCTDERDVYGSQCGHCWRVYRSHATRIYRMRDVKRVS
jgi:hypothetical protein